LDTFPIVKFGGGGSNGDAQGGTRGNQAKDVEAQELTQWEMIGETTMSERTASVAQTKKSNPDGVPSPEVEDRPVASTSSPKPSTSRSDHNDDHGEGPSTPSPTTLTRSHGFESQYGIRVRDDLSPEAMGRETCPICIVDFEEGDDIRVLPCEGKHRFHPECVDQWLLKLSSSCPICRQGMLICQLLEITKLIFIGDFLALANMISYDDENESQEIDTNGLRPELPDNRHQHHLTSGSRRHGPSMYGSNRFSRYLRFATGRRHQRLQQVRENQDDEHQESRSDVLSTVSPHIPQGADEAYH